MAKPSKHLLALQARQQREREAFAALDPAHRAEMLAHMKVLGETEAGFLYADARASVLAGDEKDFCSNAFYWRVAHAAQSDMERLGIEPLEGHFTQLQAAFRAAYFAVL